MEKATKSDMTEVETTIDCKGMKYEDLVTFSNVFASEFNNSSLHDRVLVFEVLESLHKPEQEAKEKYWGEDDEESDRPEKKEEVQVEEMEKVEDGEEKEVDSLHDRVLVFEVLESLHEPEQEAKEKYWGEDDEESDRPEKKEEVQVGEMEKVEDGEEKEVEEENGDDDDKYVKYDDDDSDDDEKGMEGKQAEGEKVTNSEQKVEEEQPSGTEIEEGENSRSGDEKSLDAQTKQHKIFVHSCWLAVQSPYFRALFYSGMKESFSKEVIMNITESELEAHLTLIEAMYHMEVLDDKDYSLVLQVLVLANMYDVALLFKKCNYVLMSTSLTLESCEDILQTVKDLPGCADLQNVLEKFLVKEFTPFDQTWILDKFISLSEASLRLLLSSNDLPVQCENTIFVALMKWIGANLSSKGFHLLGSTLLQLVRFELMTIDFLCDVVCHHAVAKKMQGFDNFLQKGSAYHGFSMARKQQMKNKPVQRVKPCCSMLNSPTFSWIIDKDKRKKLSDSSTIWSNQYWFQGYQMQLELCYNSNSNSFGIFMCIVNIVKELSYL